MGKGVEAVRLVLGLAPEGERWGGTEYPRSNVGVARSGVHPFIQQLRQNPRFRISSLAEIKI
jgi:hypothetical protein